MTRRTSEYTKNKMTGVQVRRKKLTGVRFDDLSAFRYDYFVCQFGQSALPVVNHSVTITVMHYVCSLSLVIVTRTTHISSSLRVRLKLRRKSIPMRAIRPYAQQ